MGKALFEQYQEPKIRSTEMIPESIKRAYSTTKLQRYLTYDDIIAQVPDSAKVRMERPVTMENLPLNDGNGQSYGYIIYRKLADVSNGADFEVNIKKIFNF